MEEHPCAQCALRACYDENPNSLKGRFWRWHIRYCPGWKAYVKSLPKDAQEDLRKQYGLRI